MRACEREGVPKCLQNAGAFLIAFRLLLLYFETTVWLAVWSRNAWIRTQRIDHWVRHLFPAHCAVLGAALVLVLVQYRCCIASMA